MRHILSDIHGMTIRQAIRMIYAVLFNLDLKGDGLIRVTPTTKGFSFSLNKAGRGSDSEPDVYSGPFRVSINSDGVTVDDGSDPDSANAGMVYYNLVKVNCVKASAIASAVGYLCIAVSHESSAYSVSYSIKQDVPSMPIQTQAGQSTTVYYPLARLIASGSSYRIVQLHRWHVPHLFCFGPCE